jgi:hypothetical protein
MQADKALCSNYNADILALQTVMMVREEEAAGLVRLREQHMRISAKDQQLLGPAEVTHETATRWLLVTDVFCPGDTLR